MKKTIILSIALLILVSDIFSQQEIDAQRTSEISEINKSEYTTDQKVLMFRKAMELAVTDEQKKQVLQEISENSTLLSLVFVAKYLDNSDLQQTAVQAVNAIVLANNDLFGPAAEDIVQKAITFDKNEDAGCRKQALLKHLASLPKENGYVSMFNGKDLSGWKGLVGNPISRSLMDPGKLADEQKKADERMRCDWKAQNGMLVYEGSGYDNLCSDKIYEISDLSP